MAKSLFMNLKLFTKTFLIVLDLSVIEPKISRIASRMNSSGWTSNLVKKSIFLMIISSQIYYFSNTSVFNKSIPVSRS